MFIQSNVLIGLRNVLICFLFCMAVVSCVAKEDQILPTKYDREAIVNRYKLCVASNTNRQYDEDTRPDIIVRSSMNSCYHRRNQMLSEYPKHWRENYLKEVDAELYEREVSWIIETRGKNK